MRLSKRKEKWSLNSKALNRMEKHIAKVADLYGISVTEIVLANGMDLLLDKYKNLKKIKYWADVIQTLSDLPDATAKTSLSEEEYEDLLKGIRMPDAVYSSIIPPIFEYESLDEYFESDAHQSHLEYLRTFSAGDIEDDELAEYTYEGIFDTKTPWLSGVEYAGFALGDIKEDEPQVIADTDYAFLNKYLKEATTDDLGGMVMYSFAGTGDDAKKIADECRENGFCENVNETNIAGMYSFM